MQNRAEVPMVGKTGGRIRRAATTRLVENMSEDASVIDCPKGLEPLLGYLEQLTGPASLSRLEALLRSTRMTRQDFGSFCNFGLRSYKRNVIARSRWFDLALLCWRPGQRSPIHDHRNSACAFRVIEGEGTETRFELTGQGKEVHPVESHDMPEGYICAAHDGDIHDVANQTDSDLITLHAYSPRLKMTTYPRPASV
ncbi:MAG: cysteine dioxygenase [Phycisphaerales bacterium JB065]